VIIDFLMRYLNSVVLTAKITRFPDDFITSSGELIIEMISNLAGSKRPAHLKGILISNSKDQSKYGSLKSLLQFLTSQGAILPNVKPEFLMSPADFADRMQKKIVRQLLGSDYFNAPDPSSESGTAVQDFISYPSFTSALMPHLKAVNKLYRAISVES
jgi:hypothetical protein